MSNDLYPLNIVRQGSLHVGDHEDADGGEEEHQEVASADPHWSSSRDWTFFLYQAFRPCQKKFMTRRKILRCVTTFSLGNFWR